jgi:radical SAM/Cys-rich protein
MTAAFSDTIKKINPAFTTFDSLKTLQINLGDLCNLQCSHCHVAASPAGKRNMGISVAEKIVAALDGRSGLTLDITGGCPEMNPNFRFLIEQTDRMELRRIVRSNLAVIEEPGMEWLPEFYRDHGLALFCSLPCYTADNVDNQRGDGVFASSIQALRRLNAVGYGSTHELNLVYNPGGDFLPGPQRVLEDAYRGQLRENFAIRFTNLYTITNAPVGRFRDYLEKNGALEKYLNLLASHFNPDAAGGIMCRSLISVDWRGVLYNCDFNQAMDLPLRNRKGDILTIDNLDDAARAGTELILDRHCYCCTAGEGSSCTGSLAA